MEHLVITVNGLKALIIITKCSILYVAEVLDLPLDNFDTEKCVSNWTESTVTFKHLNCHISFRVETHEKADENVIVSYGQNKVMTLQDYFVCICLFFSYLDDVKLFFYH